MSIDTQATGLFGVLPPQMTPLPDDEARLLRSLPFHGDDEWVGCVAQEDEAACLRLERRGLVKVTRSKDDPIAHRPTMHAGRMVQAAIVRALTGQDLP